MPGKTQPKSFSGRKYHSISDLQFVFLFGPENGVTLLFENLLMSVKLGEPLFSKKKPVRQSPHCIISQPTLKS